MDEERVIYEGYPAWRFFLPHAIGVLLVAGLIASATDPVSSTFLVLASFPIIAILRFRRKYTATDHRVILRTGLLARNTDEIPSRYISATRVKQSVWDRLLGIGTIEFTSMSDSDYVIRFIGVPAPQELKESLRVVIHVE